MITIDGMAKIRVSYSIDLEMTVEEWDDLSEREQNEIIEIAADWADACRNGEIEDIEIDEVLEDGVPA
jgi:hypothetical protein